ncbi:GGDEF domain-containing protein [Salinisphaera sp. LB1]|uniref:GGDEF domain-containing protein n=1 Tax=Salinisphaera sp. LB1 TaxID=2183911 RepID=UPI000D7D5935|nr:GGDEF domain-containing protein [Salinisphaera sp. LB1]AWN14240.1 diguanylate cyclase/phosphodiesterase (GGDEF & EAL domains) with PAS/PAC sensor(s) [Salinisphaera sp. LB1]
MINSDRESSASQTPLSLGNEGEKDASARVKARQRLRLQRTALAVANYAVIAFYTLYLYLSGQLLLYPAIVVFLYLAVVVAYCVFFWLMATGRNLRLKDPSLTWPQLTLAAAFAIVLFAASRTIFAQDLYFISFLMSLLFGSFRLNLKQILATELPVFGGFTAILILKHDHFQETLGGAVAHVAIYFALAVWMMFFASYISRLRLVLSARNKDLRQALGRINEIATKDELTGAYNRRFILAALEREIERAKRSGEPFSVCLLDVDNFKGINDGYGHLVGDDILRELVERISECIRGADELQRWAKDRMLSRFGGEEFLLALPLTDLQGAYTCAERVHNAIGSHPFKTKAGTVKVSASLGIAEYCSAHDTIENLLGRADAALYKAKDNGRDRVEVSLTPEPAGQSVDPTLAR